MGSTSAPLSVGGGSLLAAIAVNAATEQGAPFSVIAYQRGASVRVRLTCLRCGYAKSTTRETDETPATEDLQAFAAPYADAHEAAGCVALHEVGRPLEELLDEAVSATLGARTDTLFDLIRRLAAEPSADMEVIVASRSQSPVVLDATPAGLAVLHAMAPHPNVASHDRVLAHALATSSFNVTVCVMDGADLAAGGRRWFFFLPDRTLTLETAPAEDSLLLTSGQDAGPDAAEASTLQPINHLRLAVATVLAAP